MARLIPHTQTGPHEIKPSEKSTWVCMCGLSGNYPICDGSHKRARQQEEEGKWYRYEGEKAVEIPDPEQGS